MSGNFGKLKTAWAFTKNIFTVGAIFETSGAAEAEICRQIPQGYQGSVVEFGMGHGNITKKILDRMGPEGRVYAFEIHEDFCTHVEEKLNDSRLIIVNDDASSLRTHVKDKVGFVLGSIPYSFFSKEKSQQILQDSYELLEPGGFYSQVLYTRHNFKKFKAVFDRCVRLKVKGSLREYVYHCQKEKNTNPAIKKMYQGAKTGKQ
ncbi:MAG TPA: methyltransferase domain-containing protein [Saprospiraceae bacterium]|nr:methyltransferase domain-containing protein [Saprospiraceae bacterium]